VPRPPGLSLSDLRIAPRERHTARLRLEAPRACHAEAVADSINSSLPLLRFIAWGQHPVDLDWAQRFCERGLAMVETGECLIFNAFEASTGAFVGRIDLHTIDLEAPRCEIGYVGDHRQAGRGLMREAVLAVVELAFELGFARVHAISDIRNERALRFAESLGFAHEGVLKNYERDPWGELCTQAMYAAYAPASPTLPVLPSAQGEASGSPSGNR
jgi:RimJ/RimL family protein N-acetyltransferase